MPIAQSSIDRFLARLPPSAPTVKGANAGYIQQLIRSALGGHLPILKTEPRWYQWEGLAFSLAIRRALLFYEMQVGKSKIALDYATSLRQAGLWTGKGIIIAHSPAGLITWENEIPKHSDLKAISVRATLDDLITALESDCDLIIVPWSGLQNIFSTAKYSTRKGKMLLVPEHEMVNIASEAFSLAIVDEIHLIKNPKTLRYKIGTALLKECEYRLALTGTPFGRDLFNLWAQIHLIDDGRLLGKNYYFFEQCFGKAKYNWHTGHDKMLFDDDKKSILIDWLNSISLSYRREEVAETNVIHEQINLRMIGPQAKAYKDMIDKIIKLHSGETQEAEATFIRLRQISSGYLPFVSDDGIERRVHFPNTPKLKWLGELVENLPAEVQTIIFCDYVHTGELITEVLQAAGKTFGWLHGTITASKRRKLITDFQTGVTQYFVANSVSGGTSLDMSNADYVLFFESPVSPIVRAQAQGRPMARGDRVLTVHDLVCSGVEQKILGFIQEGKNLSRSIFSNRKSFADLAEPDDMPRKSKRYSVGDGKPPAVTEDSIDVRKTAFQNEQGKAQDTRRAKPSRLRGAR